MKLVIVPAALAELRDVTAYYSTVANAALGRSFVDEFERAVNLVLSNPVLGSPFMACHRQFSLRRFPYRIIYQLTADELRVIAVAHQRRRPGYWKKRARI